jgi:DNA repair protein RecN (Recombination protein N)
MEKSAAHPTFKKLLLIRTFCLCGLSVVIDITEKTSTVKKYIGLSAKDDDHYPFPARIELVSGSKIFEFYFRLGSACFGSIFTFDRQIMLVRLFIRNYALIDELEVTFDRGLTVITGETGAGKSILLGALSLILGQRADTSALLNKSTRCIVEGEFDIEAYDLEKFFSDHQLDYDKRTLVRREITPEGKSRAFINDSPVNLMLLRHLTTQLVDIHSQNETLQLNDAAYQLYLVDAMARHLPEVRLFSHRYHDWKNHQSELQKMIEQQQQAEATQDYLRFLLKELAEINPEEGEFSRLESEVVRLRHVLQIRESLYTSLHLLNGNDHSILTQLRQVLSSLRTALRFDERLAEPEQRLQSVYAELKDLAAEIEQLAEQSEVNPERLQQAEERMDVLQRLAHKHRVQTPDELPEKRKEIETKLSQIENLDQVIEQMRQQCNQEKNALLQQAMTLHQRRQAAAAHLEKDLMQMLGQTGMKEARLKILVNDGGWDALSPTGTDRIEMLFSAHRDIEPAPLSRVASGGERSRLMLCLKARVAHHTALPTIIFDEIDSGISGNIALKVGNIIRSMARNMQVIVITHLPQMAGRGHAHYHVYKEKHDNRTVTRIQLLNEQERIREIARMLTGDRITEAGLSSARELINS